MTLVACIGICTFQEVGTSSGLCRLGSAGKLLSSQPIQRIWVSCLLVPMRGLVAGVCEWIGLVPGSVDGKPWYLNALQQGCCLGLQGQNWFLDPEDTEALKTTRKGLASGSIKAALYWNRPRAWFQGTFNFLK